MSKSLGNVVDAVRNGPEIRRGRVPLLPAARGLLRAGRRLLGEGADQARKLGTRRQAGKPAEPVARDCSRSISAASSPAGASEPEDAVLSACGRGSVPAVAAAMDEVAFHKALAAIIELVTKGERVRGSRPSVGGWRRTRRSGARLGTVLYNASRRPAWPALLMAPFTPTAAQKLWEALVPGGGPLENARIDRTARGAARGGRPLPKACIVFPKIEV